MACNSGSLPRRPVRIMRARSRREVVLKERAVVEAARREGRREFIMADMVIVFFLDRNWGWDVEVEWMENNLGGRVVFLFVFCRFWYGT